MAQKDDAFEHSCSDSPKIFPIDYTQAQLIECLATPLPVGKVKAQILEHPFFYSILGQLRFAKPDQGKKIKSVIPIPLEAVPLLKCFYNVAVENEEFEEEILKKRAATGGRTAQKTRDAFVRELCRSLYEETAPKSSDEKGDVESIDDNAYCRHILFQNDSFKQILMEDLMQREFEDRISTIRELLKNLDVNTQVSALLSGILSLDHVILDLKYYLTTSKPTNEPASSQETPTQLLNQLLQSRERVDNGRSKYAKYLIHNAEFEEGKNLKDIFASKSTPSENTLKQARTAYLSNLAARIEAEDKEKRGALLSFEKWYLHIRDYLSLIAFDGDQEKEKSFILEQCKRNCAYVLEYCTYGSFSLPNSSGSQRAYHAKLLGRIISFHMNNALRPVGGAIQTLCFYSALQTRLPDTYKHDPAPFESAPVLTEDGTKSSSYTNALSVANLLQDICQSILKDAAPIYDSSTCQFTDPSGFAATLWKEAQSCQQFFYNCELPVLSESEIEQEIVILNEVLAKPAYTFFPVKVERAAYKLILLVFLQFLRNLATDTANWLNGYTKPVKQLLEIYHSSSQNR